MLKACLSWNRVYWCALLLVLSVLTACGQPFEPKTVGFELGPTAEHPWEKMEWWERNEYMRLTFMPKIRAVFEKYDKKYKEVSNLHCQTCHGEADKNKPVFKEDGTKLFPLDPDNLPTANDKDPKTAKVTKFMIDDVMPAMKKLLRRNDLTCFTCHAKKSK